jgi:hypothetical protein
LEIRYKFVVFIAKWIVIKILKFEYPARNRAGIKKNYLRIFSMVYVRIGFLGKHLSGALNFRIDNEIM